MRLRRASGCPTVLTRAHQLLRRGLLSPPRPARARPSQTCPSKRRSIELNLTTLGWDEAWGEALAVHEDRALTPARVLAVHRGRYAVRAEHGDALVPAAGALEAAARDPAELPAVGDWVALRRGEAIRHVLPRRTVLARADDDARQEALAGNVDLCLVTTSLDLDLNLRRLERFVALARAGGVDVLLVCTKGALPRAPAGQAADVAAAVGAEAIVLSALDGW